jgi:hypothetical protein
MTAWAFCRLESRSEQICEPLAVAGMRGVVGQVVVLALIRDVVVEFDTRLSPLPPLGVAPAFRPNAATDHPAVDLGEGGLFSRMGGIFEDSAGFSKTGRRLIPASWWGASIRA